MVNQNSESLALKTEPTKLKQIELCADGKYRWAYEYDMLRNPSILFVVLKIFAYCGKGESVSKRLLSVKTIDGKLSDKWLEDFGSFANRLMINSLENVRLSQTMWMEYDYGVYLAREISADPIFGHDSGWLEEIDSEPKGEEYSKCTYENGQLTFEDVKLGW